MKDAEDYLTIARDLLAKKGADYAGPLDRYENFKHSASVTAWFNDQTDKVFVTLITTKMTRLATLLNRAGPPNNESIEDSFVDLINYCALWAGWRSSFVDDINQGIPGNPCPPGSIVPVKDCFLDANENLRVNNPREYNDPF